MKSILQAAQELLKAAKADPAAFEELSKKFKEKKAAKAKGKEKESSADKSMGMNTKNIPGKEAAPGLNKQDNHMGGQQSSGPTPGSGAGNIVKQDVMPGGNATAPSASGPSNTMGSYGKSEDVSKAVSAEWTPKFLKGEAFESLDKAMKKCDKAMKKAKMDESLSRTGRVRARQERNARITGTPKTQTHGGGVHQVPGTFQQPKPQAVRSHAQALRGLKKDVPTTGAPAAGAPKPAPRSVAPAAPAPRLKGAPSPMAAAAGGKGPIRKDWIKSEAISKALSEDFKPRFKK